MPIRLLRNDTVYWFGYLSGGACYVRRLRVCKQLWRGLVGGWLGNCLVGDEHCHQTSRLRATEAKKFVLMRVTIVRRSLIL